MPGVKKSPKAMPTKKKGKSNKGKAMGSKPTVQQILKAPLTAIAAKHWQKTVRISYATQTPTPLPPIKRLPLALKCATHN